jgi:hypothetical protein
LGRPTNSGITMCGKITTSRKGNKGNSMAMAGNGVRPDMGKPLSYLLNMDCNAETSTLLDRLIIDQAGF